MGARSGGGGVGWEKPTAHGASFDRATFALNKAIESGNKESIAKATSNLKNVASKMPTASVQQIAFGASEAAYLTQKKFNPPSEYSPAMHKYNQTLAKVFNQEAKKRK